MSIRELYESLSFGSNISLCVDAPELYGGTHEIFYGDIADLRWKEFITDTIGDCDYAVSQININKIDVVDGILTLYMDF